MLNKSPGIQLPWNNLDVLPIIKVRAACLLWCPPYHVWPHDLSDQADVTFCQVFKWFAWLQSSVTIAHEGWHKRNYIPHQTLLLPQSIWMKTRAASGLIRHLAACPVQYAAQGTRLSQPNSAMSVVLMCTSCWLSSSCLYCEGLIRRLWNGRFSALCPVSQPSQPGPAPCLHL